MKALKSHALVMSSELATVCGDQANDAGCSSDGRVLRVIAVGKEFNDDVVVTSYSHCFY